MEPGPGPGAGRCVTVTREDVKRIHLAVLDTLTRTFRSPEGGGMTVRALSNLELAFFLLAIASADGHVEDREASLIDYLCGMDVPQLFRAKAAHPQVYERVAEGVPGTLVYFVNEENSIAHNAPEAGRPHLVDPLIALYSAAGGLLADPDPAAVPERTPGFLLYGAMMDRYHAYAGAHRYKPEPPEAGLAS